MKQGYGRVRLTGRPVDWAHRVALLLATGERPAVVRHTCDNPPCVNPLHLLGGTQADNVADKWARGRQGERNTRMSDRAAQLTGAETPQAIATRFNVSRRSAQRYLSLARAAA